MPPVFFKVIAAQSCRAIIHYSVFVFSYLSSHLSIALTIRHNDNIIFAVNQCPVKS